MNATDILLGLKPRDAIIRMINNENGTELPFESFVVSAPRPGVGNETHVTVSAVRSSSDEQDNPYSGSIEFTYNRLNLADQFLGLLSNFRPPMPTSTQVLLNELTRLTGIEFELDDIVLEDIVRNNAAPYRIKAKAESLRWVGYVDVTVLDLSDLQATMETLLPPTTGPRLGQINNTPQLTSQQLNLPLVNLTAYQDEISRLIIDQPAQASLPLVWLVKQTVPIPGSRIDQGFANWVCLPTPGPFNLFNAKVKDIVTGTASVNPAIPELDAYVEIHLDPAFCTNFQDPVMRLGFKNDPMSGQDFSFQPRLTQVAVISDTDGSAYNEFLNALETGDVITSLDPYWQYLTTDGRPWIAALDAAGPTSLYNAVVQYNGQLRPQDLPPENQALNRVLVVTLSEDNTAYRGNFSIFYMAPVVLPAALPNGYLNQAYNVSLAATAGTGPFSYALVVGAFSTGQAIDPTTGMVSGAPKSTGTFRPTIEVTAGNGTKVRYTYTYTVTIAQLSITGKATNPVVGVPYSYAYVIAGGVGPYTLDLASGNLGAGMSIDRTGHRIIGVPTATGAKTFSLVATDSRGVTIPINDGYEILGA